MHNRPIEQRMGTDMAKKFENPYATAHEYPNYRIACDNEPIPTYTVVYRPTDENLSHHETALEARQAARRYQQADDRRRA